MKNQKSTLVNSYMALLTLIQKSFTEKMIKNVRALDLFTEELHDHLIVSDKHGLVSYLHFFFGSTLYYFTGLFIHILDIEMRTRTSVFCH